MGHNRGKFQAVQHRIIGRKRHRPNNHGSPGYYIQCTWGKCLHKQDEKKQRQIMVHVPLVCFQIQERHKTSSKHLWHTHIVYIQVHVHVSCMETWHYY